MGRPKELFKERCGQGWEGEGGQESKVHHVMEAKQATIKLEDGSLIVGKINLLAEPAQDHDGLYLKHLDDRGTYYKRISDIFTKGKNRFVVVFDANVEGQEGRVLIINKNKILWISPDD